jgi:hypothetical protein
MIFQVRRTSLTESPITLEETDNDHD